MTSPDTPASPDASKRSAGSERNLTLDYSEFAVADIARAKAFYGAAFGWRFRDFGDAYCEFDDGRRTGGLHSLSPPQPKGGPLLVLFADDLEDAQARVEAAGGVVVRGIFDFPGGRRFHFTDPDGYELAVWSDAAPPDATAGSD